MALLVLFEFVKYNMIYALSSAADCVKCDLRALSRCSKIDGRHVASCRVGAIQWMHEDS